MPKRRSTLTPQFEFDDATGQYRNVRTGRFVSPLTVRSALDDYWDAKIEEGRALSLQLRNRTISIQQWQEGMENLTAKVNLVGASAAKGGWHNMETADFGRVGQLIKQEFGGVKGQHLGLRGFAKQIEQGLPLDGRFLQRAEQYLSTGRHTFHVVETREMKARGQNQQRYIRHARDSCVECVELVALGWHETGSTPEPGERICKRKCRCGKEYRAGES